MDRRSKLVNQDTDNLIYRDSLLNGVPVLVVEKTANVFDPITGKNTETRVEHKVHLALTWSVTETEKFAYDISYLAANKNFTHGGEYQIGDRHMLIAGRYFPELTSSLEDIVIVYNSEEYQIVKSSKLDGDSGVFFHLRNTKQDRYLEQANLNEVLGVNDVFES